MRLAAALAFALSAVPAAASCRLALILALDVSASVDPEEYLLQSVGLAEALRAPEVRQAFLSVPDRPVALAVFEWSGRTFQRGVADWALMADDAALDAMADAITAPREAPVSTTTAIGAAMLHAGAMFAGGPDCAARTLDISGDGLNNDAVLPEEARLDSSLDGVTINGLVIGADYPLDHELNPNRRGALTRYYANRVIKGPGAFVETADDFSDFPRAMRRKLVRELGSMAVGEAPPTEAAPPSRARAMQAANTRGPLVPATTVAATAAPMATTPVAPPR